MTEKNAEDKNDQHDHELRRQDSKLQGKVGEIDDDCVWEKRKTQKNKWETKNKPLHFV